MPNYCYLGKMERTLIKTKFWSREVQICKKYPIMLQKWKVPDFAVSEEYRIIYYSNKKLHEIQGFYFFIYGWSYLNGDGNIWVKRTPRTLDRLIPG